MGMFIFDNAPCAKKPETQKSDGGKQSFMKDTVEWMATENDPGVGHRRE